MASDSRARGVPVDDASLDAFFEQASRT